MRQDADERAAWVEVATADDGLRIVDVHRLDGLVKSLSRPTLQRPQIVACVGNTEKRLAYSVLFPQNPDVWTNCTHAFADLHLDRVSAGIDRESAGLDRESAGSDHPLFFVDCSPGAGCPTAERKLATRSGTHSPLPSDTAGKLILTRLLFPFVDVVCVFADDLGGLAGAATYLEQLFELASGSPGAAPSLIPTSLPWHARPSVIVVTSARDTDERDVQLREVREFNSRMRALRYRRHFSAIGCVRLWPRRAEALRVAALAREVRRTLDRARERRSAARTLFSATHLSWFFSQAVVHVARTVRDPSPFDFIATSRSPRPLHPLAASQLRAFLRVARDRKLPFETMIRVVASSVVYDAYPPSAHVFCPADTFSTIYASAIQHALETADVPLSRHPRGMQKSALVASCLSKIRAQVCEWVDAEATRGNWAKDLHIRNLDLFRLEMRWEKAKCNSSCLFCIFGRPQHVLHCGHAICDVCVQRLGHAESGMEYSYRVEVCALCRTPAQLKVVLKPPTAGIRILSIDGGGARGIVPLQFLKLLQAEIGRGGSIQDYFDVAVGTSAGALIVLEMFRMHWDNARCIEQFCGFADCVFTAPQRSRPAPRQPMCARGYRFVEAWFGKGVYSDEVVAMLLKRCVGEQTRLFDRVVDGAPSRWKFLVTTTTVDDVSTVVFANYNPPLERMDGDLEPGAEQAAATYTRFPRSAPEDEPYLWEVAKATSAAPWFFRTVEIRLSDDQQNDSMGSHQDGAMRNPNPTDIAVEESTGHIWPCRPRRDLILSLGTGGLLRTDAPSYPTSRGPSSKRVVSRIYRWGTKTLMATVDPETVHQKVLKMLDPTEKSRYFRWNLMLSDTLPSLDDASSMDFLTQQTERCVPQGKLRDIKIALVASSFFFELDGPPARNDGGSYDCTGTIRIRGEPARVLELVRSVHSGKIPIFKNAESVDDDLRLRECFVCKRHVQRVAFTVDDLTIPFNLKLGLGRAGEHAMSGLPQTMQWFVDQQGLHDPFTDILPHVSGPNGIRFEHPGCPAVREWTGNADARPLKRRRAC
ncbi:uncharacterized protein LTR77_011005 [Saxophila tyrrhenica]|uniref:Uncharacterized protein n=1 Tax=Saxophila tyrrhenica TaxID=1690608 RepID=A0AAV9NU65_9PEZI|nr:hypothetical protein LTR77_011005 [Saxophila tyrrhenica]